MFVHHMPRKRQPVILAPLPALIGKSLRKQFAYNIVEIISDGTGSVRLIPNYFREDVQYFHCVFFTEFFGQRRRPRIYNVIVGGGKSQGVAASHLRFIGKNRRYDVAEVFAHRVVIGVVRHPYKLPHGILIHGIDVCLPVVPAAGARRNGYCIPFFARRRPIEIYLFVSLQIAFFIYLHVITGQHPRMNIRRLIFAAVLRRVAAECDAEFFGADAHYKLALTVFVIFRDDTARRSRRPPVLVIKVRLHARLFRLYHARLNKIHKLRA